MWIRNLYLKPVYLWLSGLILLTSLGSLVRRAGHLDQVLAHYRSHLPPPTGCRSLDIEPDYRPAAFQYWWHQRQKNDVIDELAPFLSVDKWYMQHDAKQALDWIGHSQNPRALQYIRSARYQISHSREWTLSELDLDLAIGRLESRPLQGQQRLDTLAANIGLSWPEIGKLSRDWNGNPRRNAYLYPIPETIYMEFVETLYDMGKRGEDITPFVSQFTLDFYGRFKIASSKLSPGQEVQFILQQMDDPKFPFYLHENLTEALRSLGPVAQKPILDRLKAIANNPSMPRSETYCISLFDAANAVCRNQATPLLKILSLNKNQKVAYRAKDSMRRNLD